MIDYYDLPQCSNSDLTDLNKLLNPDRFTVDAYDAYRMGTLVDCMITEPHLVNVYKLTCGEYSYTKAEFELCRAMKLSAYKDQAFKAYMAISTFQKVYSGPVHFDYQGVKFSLNMRCKFDFFMNGLNQGGDIKSTVATTQKAFEDACTHFGYWRSRVVYMLLSGSHKDMLIGISKVNLKVFKIPIVRGDKYWEAGLKSATELAFHYWQLFENFSPITTIS